jgi:heme A synthase
MAIASKFKKAVAGGLAALTLGGVVLTSLPTEAEARPYRYGYGYAPRYAYGPGPYYYRRRNVGGAVAAGVIGGLALGALAGAAVAPTYAAPVYGYGPTCRVVRRQGYDYYGRLVTTDTRVCN